MTAFFKAAYITSILLILQFHAIDAGRPRLKRPNFRLYHKQDVLMRLISELVERNPDFMKLENMTASDEGYTVVEVEPGGWTDRHDEKIRLLLSFGEHAREIVTSELALRILTCLESFPDVKDCLPTELEYDTLEPVLNRTVFKVCPSLDILTAVLDSFVWRKIIPVENPIGRTLFEGGNLCERKNGRGVDINRNWDFEFGIKEANFDPTEENFGAHAFSEPETVILKEIATHLRPHVWIGVHSGTCGAYMPYDHKQSIPDGTAAKEQLKVLQKLKAEALTSDCEIGSGGEKVGYVAHGTGTDYMYAVMNVPFSFTWEIYGDASATHNDCYKLFNPLTQASLNTTLSMWTSALFKLLLLIPDQPVIADGRLSENNVTTNASTDGAPTVELPIVPETVNASVGAESFNEPVKWRPVEKQKRMQQNTAPVALCLIILGVLAAIYLSKKKARNHTLSTRV